MTHATDTQLLREIAKGVFVDSTGEIIHEGPCGVRQNYAAYTAEEHETWSLLYTAQRENLEEIAYRPWLEAIDAIGLKQDRIPRLSQTSEKLQAATDWVAVPVDGFLSAEDYFHYIAHRQFPTVPRIRSRKEMDFIVEPEIFHDAFGHLPMHTHSSLADFVQLFGQTAMKAKTEQQMTEMMRLYWFTVEYCLIRVNGALKVCGSGHMSGIQESRYSLTDAVEKREFSLEAVCAQDFNPHVLQPVMFVIDSYDQVYEAMYKRAQEWAED